MKDEKMSGKILASGLVAVVRYWSRNNPDIIVNNVTFDVPEVEADKALAAQRAKPPRRVEVLEGDGTWQTRTVRLAPLVEVKARGIVCSIFDGGKVTAPSVSLWGGGNFPVSNVMDVVLRSEVEIVSIDGGPNRVRLAPPKES